MRIILVLGFLFWVTTLEAQENNPILPAGIKTIVTGAQRLDTYIPLLKGKRLGIFANSGSRVGRAHLVDTLQKLGMDIRVIFGPEHGFRGIAGAGDQVDDFIDPQSGIHVVSLYGNKQRPSEEDLKNLDALVYDIQDVGVRFYTYISSLEEFMDAAFEYGKPLLILDRPNPNGFYVDGPVLEKEFSSFVGRQPIPIVYGMTPGEYAMMLMGERWLSPPANQRSDYYKTAAHPSADTMFHFLIIKCLNYDHRSRYILPVKPSPNLPEMQSVYWYPSTCLFEGTALSEGRGTDKPFQIFGHPSLPHNLYHFKPMSNAGAKNPKYLNQECFGWNLSGSLDQVIKKTGRQLQLSYLLKAYRLFSDKKHFFLTSGNQKPLPRDFSFNRLAGNAQLMQQIKEGKTEKEIRSSWQEKLGAFKKIRKNYLLYRDFD
ncbi:MAG: DUF1343 domain-containing protein [Flavisolibacter sp.]